ncbi:RNA recognition motif-containing protein [Besnoitia besnoiti]|uniref:RNA recognition motif-containing protein n=1 Tax=Besnoitia besnoiti TaxID=94643 RepID=A0A2A9MGD2_BESBE|nr:RNA recognition motif-containing protein [Besnoitia besnoiti]PFH34442.1 RNA recognition motif-containing protein [Besnoitia besnoiti]
MENENGSVPGGGGAGSPKSSPSGAASSAMGKAGKGVSNASLSPSLAAVAAGGAGANSPQVDLALAQKAPVAAAAAGTAGSSSAETLSPPGVATPAGAGVAVAAKAPGAAGATPGNNPMASPSAIVSGPAGAAAHQPGASAGNTAMSAMSPGAVQNNAATPLTQPLPHNAPPVEIKLFVGRVPPTMEDDALRPIFEDFGDVREVYVIRDRNTQKHKNSAFVKMASLAAADACIRALHSNRILDQALGPIIVKYATGEAERLGMNSLGMGGEGGGGVDQAKLFVGSIPRTMSEDELRLFFQTYGTVEEVFVMRDSSTGTGRGCAFVKFKYKEEGLHAMRILNGKHVFEGCTRPVEVRFAESKAQRQQHVTGGQHGLGGWGGLSGGMMAQGLSGSGGMGGRTSLSGSNANPRQAGQWKEYFAPDGRPYYHNEYASVTTWERPPEFDHLPPLASLTLGAVSQAVFCAGGGAIGGMHGSHSSGGAVGGSEAAGPPGANVFVFHIPNEWTKTDLIQTFSSFGSIVSCHIPVDKLSHRNRGYAFVSYDNIQSAANAVNHMNGCLAMNKRLNVSIKKGEEHHVQHLLSAAATHPHAAHGHLHGGQPQGGAGGQPQGAGAAAHHHGAHPHLAGATPAAMKNHGVSAASMHAHPHGAAAPQQQGAGVNNAAAAMSGVAGMVGLGNPLQTGAQNAPAGQGGARAQGGAGAAQQAGAGASAHGHPHTLSSHLQLAAVGSLAAAAAGAGSSGAMMSNANPQMSGGVCAGAVQARGAGAAGTQQAFAAPGGGAQQQTWGAGPAPPPQAAYGAAAGQRFNAY